MTILIELGPGGQPTGEVLSIQELSEGIANGTVNVQDAYDTYIHHAAQTEIQGPRVGAETPWHDWAMARLKGTFTPELLNTIISSVATAPTTPVIEDPDLDAKDMEDWYDFMGERRPGRVYQTLMEEAPYSGLSQAGQQFQQQLGERAQHQYYTSPYIREGTAAQPIQTFRQFLEEGELGPLGGTIAGRKGGGQAEGTPMRIMNPTQMLARLRDVGGRIMRPGYEAPDPSAGGLGGGEQFLQERMAGTTDEEQYGFVKEPLLAQTTAFPGMREAMERMMSRRFRQQRKDSPGTPFMHWWAKESPYWE
jgi:hypothetical protein